MLITHDLGVVAETCTRMITMYAGEVIEDAAVDDALIRPLHPYTSGLLRSLPRPEPAPRHAAVDSRAACPRSPTCPRAAASRRAARMRRAGCEAEQELLDAGDGRKVRCWRFRELELPGALQHAASAPIAARVAGNDVPGRRNQADPIVSVRDLEVRFQTHGPPRDRQGGRRRQLRRPPRRDVRHHRRIRIGQDHDRPRAGVSAEADARAPSCTTASIRRRCRGRAFRRAIAATTRSSFRIRTPR